MKHYAKISLGLFLTSILASCNMTDLWENPTSQSFGEQVIQAGVTYNDVIEIRKNHQTIRQDWQLVKKDFDHSRIPHAGDRYIVKRAMEGITLALNNMVIAKKDPKDIHTTDLLIDITMLRQSSSSIVMDLDTVFKKYESKLTGAESRKYGDLINRLKILTLTKWGDLSAKVRLLKSMGKMKDLTKIVKDAGK